MQGQEKGQIFQCSKMPPHNQNRTLCVVCPPVPPSPPPHPRHYPSFLLAISICALSKVSRGQTVLGRGHILSASHLAVSCRHLSASACDFEVRMWWKPRLTERCVKWGTSIQKVEDGCRVRVLRVVRGQNNRMLYQAVNLSQVEPVDMLKGPVSPF